MANEVKYPQITVQLVGQDGNVFNLIGIIRRAMRREGLDAKAVSDFTEEVMNQKSYTDALGVMMRTVNVE